MNKVRIGLLGVSWWTDVVWPGFSQAENAEITYVAARRPEKAEAFAREHGVPRWSASYADVIDSPDVDAVFVGLPNYLHHQTAMDCLSAGKHVLQEKPMALSVAEAREQADFARKRGLVLMVNHEIRLADGARDLPGLVAGQVGPLRKLVLGNTMASSGWEGWRADASLSGGTLFEIVIHQLDFSRWLWGRNPLTVWAQGQDVPGQDLTVVLDYGGGDSAIIDYCWRSIGFRLRVETYGSRGYVLQETSVPFGPSLQTIVTEEGRDTTEFEGAIQGAITFRRVLEGFAAAILRGAEPPVTPEDGIWAVRMAEGARDSLRSGAIVRFE